jgi:hypothetical protein
MLASRTGTPRLTIFMGCHPAGRSKNLISQLSVVIAQAEAEQKRSTKMRDIIFVAVTIAFFLISIAYVRFCDRIR